MACLPRLICGHRRSFRIGVRGCERHPIRIYRDAAGPISCRGRIAPANRQRDGKSPLPDLRLVLTQARGCAAIADRACTHKIAIGDSDLINVRIGRLCGLKSDISRGRKVPSDIRLLNRWPRALDLRGLLIGPTAGMACAAEVDRTRLPLLRKIQKG
jgi:hypothetical protein